MITSGTLTMVAGATGTTVTGPFGAADYAVSISTSWINNGYRISGKTTGQYVVTFATPAPTSGTSTMSWFAYSDPTAAAATVPTIAMSTDMVGMMLRAVPTSANAISGQSWLFDSATNQIRADGGNTSGYAHANMTLVSSAYGFQPVTPLPMSLQTLFGQNNYIAHTFSLPTADWNAIDATGNTQRAQALFYIEGTNVGGTAIAHGRIPAVFIGQTGGGNAGGGGNPIWGTNTIVVGYAADTETQLVGSEISLTNNQADAVLDTNPVKVGMSVSSLGTKRCSAGFVVSGAAGWLAGFQVDQGAIPTAGFAFRYRGDGNSQSAVTINSYGNMTLGFQSTAALGARGEPILLNGLALNALKSDTATVMNLIKANTSDRVELDTGGLGVQYGLPVVAAGGGAAPTFTTIGAPGPTTAGQSGWKKEWDSAGNAYFIPIWR